MVDERNELYDVMADVMAEETITSVDSAQAQAPKYSVWDQVEKLGTNLYDWNLIMNEIMKRLSGEDVELKPERDTHTIRDGMDVLIERSERAVELGKKILDVL